MNNKNRDIQLTFMLLRTFCTRQDLSAILDLGYSYESIAYELERCIKDDDIVDVNGKLQITEKGIKKSSELVKFLKNKKKDGWTQNMRVGLSKLRLILYICLKKKTGSNFAYIA